MLVDWENVRLVTFGHHNITVVMEAGSRTFEFNSNIEAKIAFEDWVSVPNARGELCRGLLVRLVRVDRPRRLLLSQPTITTSSASLRVPPNATRTMFALTIDTPPSLIRPEILVCTTTSSVPSICWML